MQVRGEHDQWSEFAVVGRLEGVDVVVAVVAGHDDGQVAVLEQVLGDEGARDAAVAISEGARRHDFTLPDAGMAVDVGCWKSSVFAASTVLGAFTRSGQSAAVMSQNLHSRALGTGLGGSVAASLRMVDPGWSMN